MSLSGAVTSDPKLNLGGVVMVSGIGFLTVITASVTAALIEAARRRLRSRTDEDLAASLNEIGTRLTAIEAGLAARDGRKDPGGH